MLLKTCQKKDNILKSNIKFGITIDFIILIFYVFSSFDSRKWEYIILHSILIKWH